MNAIYPKFKGPAAEIVKQATILNDMCGMANDRADRWQGRYEQMTVQRDAALAEGERLTKELARKPDPSLPKWLLTVRRWRKKVRYALKEDS